METLKAITVIILIMIMTGCASIYIDYDYDPLVDFAGIRTYDWLPIPEKARANELTIKHIKSAVNRELAAKGLIPASKDSDVFIALHGGRERKVDVQEWGYAYRRGGYYGRGPYGGRPYRGYAGPETVQYRSGVDTYEYEVGTLILDFVDAKKKELVWRGTAHGVIDPQITREFIDETVAKILANYPPPSQE